MFRKPVELTLKQLLVRTTPRFVEFENEIEFVKFENETVLVEGDPAGSLSMRIRSVPTTEFEVGSSDNFFCSLAIMLNS
jgi:hypothetical protein